MQSQMNEGNGAEEAKPSQTLAIGEVVADKYRIESLLGSGGMAEVYAAVNIKTDRRVALKWILPALSASREVLARFRREALAAGRINHPNVVTIFDVVEHQGSACMVMELLSGETLADYMKRKGPSDFVEAVAIMLPAMRGVAAAHAHGVIHRDLKPDNIFLCMDADGSIRDCKVLDFGVSKLTVADAATTGDITLSGNVVGTPEYMAPEQVRAGKHADHRIDIYSLGVVFYEMIAGRPPFVGEHFSGLMLDIMQRDPPPLVSLRSDVPKRLAGVIHKAIARDLDKRYLDMPGFIRGLEEVGRMELKLAMGTPVEGLITQLAMPRLTPDQQFPAPKDRRAASIVAAIGVALVFSAIWLWLGSRHDPARQEAALPVSASPVPAAAAAPAAVPAEPAVAAVPAAAADVAEERARAERAQAEAAPKGEAAPTPTPAPEAKAAHAGPTHVSHRQLRTDAAERTKVEAAQPAPIGPAKAPGTSIRTTRAGKLSVDDF